MEESEYMAKMRVHELAKELEIKSQEIIDSLSSCTKGRGEGKTRGEETCRC